MADWGGKVAAWFAGVAVASAALAALVPLMTTPPLRGVLHEFFYALVFIAAVAFIMLVLTGPRALWGAWRTRKTASSSPSESVPAPEPGHLREDAGAVKRAPATERAAADRSPPENAAQGTCPSVSVRGDNSGIVAVGDGTINIQRR